MIKTTHFCKNKSDGAKLYTTKIIVYAYISIKW